MIAAFLVHTVEPQFCSLAKASGWRSLHFQCFLIWSGFYPDTLLVDLLKSEVKKVDNSVKKNKFKDTDSDYVKLAKSGGHTSKYHCYTYHIYVIQVASTFHVSYKDRNIAFSHPGMWPSFEVGRPTTEISDEGRPLLPAVLLSCCITLANISENRNFLFDHFLLENSWLKSLVIKIILGMDRVHGTALLPACLPISL